MTEPGNFLLIAAPLDWHIEKLTRFGAQLKLKIGRKRFSRKKKVDF